MYKTVQNLYEFGPFVLDPGERLLHYGASRLELPPRAFDTLLALIENNGRLLEKDTLMRTVWGDTIVEENNLSQVIYMLRKALRDGEDGSRYIETVPKRGYRFVAAVKEKEKEKVRETFDSSGNHSGQLHASAPPAASSADAIPPDHPLAAEHDPHTADRLYPYATFQHGLLIILAVLFILALLIAASVRRGLFQPAEPGPIRSIAVLPMQNLSTDPSQEYFVDSMTDELITDLAQIHELKIVSKTSVMQYKGTRSPLPQIGRDLGVDAIIEGSVLRSGDKVRITAQLIRASTDRHIWAAAYDGDMKDILSLQARVAEAITNEVKLNLTAEESRLLHPRRDPAPEAVDLYLRGRYAFNQRNVDGFHKSIQYFNAALKKDPNFAQPYAGLADSYTLLVLYGSDPALMDDAKTAAEQALELDPNSAEAHTSLAAILILHDWDWSAAEREFQRALELNPNSARAHHWYGNLLLGPEGRHDEAIAELQRARELDPLSAIINADTGYAYYLAGRYDLALPIYQKVLAANPDFLPVHFYLAQYYRQNGQYDLWLQEIMEDYRLAGFPAHARSVEQLYRQGGFRSVLEAEAKSPASLSPAMSKKLRLDVCNSAQADVALGKNIQALNALEDCYRDDDIALLYAKVDPAWTPIRPTPRFQSLLQRIGLQ